MPCGSHHFNTMSALEFIRKNSMLVLIVVAGVGLGLIMMDYGDSSKFSRDFYIQVNGKNYTYPEAAALGENGQAYLQSLNSSAGSKVQAMFDKDGDEELSQTEASAMQAWLSQHPEFQQMLDHVSDVYQSWSYGFAEDGGLNVAVNRAILHAEAENLGISPSKEQVDAYLQAMPAFKKADGSFDQELYHRLTGFRNGMANNPQEQAFRAVIADMMVWESLAAMLTDGLQFQTSATSELIDVFSQQLRGKSVWLPVAAAQAPADPTEEELKAFWEENKEQYKSEERRIISVYLLTPAADSSLDALMVTADTLMQDLSLANGKGFAKMLEAAATTPENEPFTYLTPEGKSHVTLPLSTLSQAADLLKTEVEHNGSTTTLGDIAYKEVATAPSVADYEAAVKAGTDEQLPSIRQIRGYFPTRDGKLAFLRVEAIETPTVLEFEAARERALVDLKKQRAENALQLAAEKLFAEMSETVEKENLDAALAKAAAAGASVEDFGPVGMGLAAANLPEGVETQALMSVPTGKLAPLVVIPGKGARVAAVTERTVEMSPEYSSIKAFSLIPSQNARLRGQVLLDWLHNAYTRYDVKLAEGIKLNN